MRRSGWSTRTRTTTTELRLVSLRWQCVVVDWPGPEPLATFWAAAPGWGRTHVSADGGEIVLEPPEGSPEDGVSPDLLFIRVPDPTPGKAGISGSSLTSDPVGVGKNPLHFDLRPLDQAAEVDRLIGLGAS